MLRIAVLASGRGSNLAALVAASTTYAASGKSAFQIIGVFSNRADAEALNIARRASIPAHALPPVKGEDREVFDRRFFDAVIQSQPDLIICAGYMRIISADALKVVSTPVINIHPSLLPRYPGLHTHARALEAGDKQHGTSVHVVTAELDAGPLIAQAAIDIEKGDTPESLSARLLAREHELLPACVQLIACGKLTFDDGSPYFEGHPLHAPLQWPWPH